MKKTIPAPADALRQRAESSLAGEPEESPVSSGELRRLVHELRVHQIELELQNDELRGIQAELEVSRNRYLELYEYAPVGYLTLSHDGLVASINLTGARILGKTRQELTGHHFARCVTPEDAAKWRKFLLAALQPGGTLTCEINLQRGDGTSFIAYLNCLPFSGEDATQVLRVSLLDVTERRHAEEELRIAAIAFESQEGMVVTDPRGVIVRVNRAFTRLTGYAAAEAIGNSPAMLHSGRHSAEFYQRMWGSLKENGYWQGEIWNRRKNGRVYAEWLTISAVISPEGITTHYVGTFSEITENKEAEAEIHRLAYYDPLTQLPNRRLLLDRLAQAMAGSRRTSHHGALIFLDLDGFKTLNDTRGHGVGDQLLIEIAQRILCCVREGDSVARLGGDEFVVMLEGLSEDIGDAAVQVGQVGEKIRLALGHPYELDGGEYRCTASLGIALFHGHEETVENLLKHADLAMYKAKEGGRNAARFFDPAMQTALDERTALEVELRHALVRGQLMLHFQAQLDGERRVLGAEVLLRWQHPSRGLVQPADFIPLAEETGLILPIGQWVLESACAQIRKWSADAALRDLHLAVNVSARQFHQPDFVDQVSDILATTGADPTRLKIEITESMVLEDIADTFKKMHALKTLGIGFALDDFGTGHSSLSYLSRLPLDQLKIDRSFVLNLPDNANDAVIAQTIVSMARSLGLDVVAEGVETEAQRTFLALQRCHAYQGYLFSRPLPLPDFEQYCQAIRAIPSRPAPQSSPGVH